VNFPSDGKSLPGSDGLVCKIGCEAEGEPDGQNCIGGLEAHPARESMQVHPFPVLSRAAGAALTREHDVNLVPALREGSRGAGKRTRADPRAHAPEGGLCIHDQESP
jgi:hypothetical protein